LKEFGDPSRKALIVQYAPPQMRGRVIGAYYLIRDTVVAGGSFVGAAGTVFYVATRRQGGNEPRP